MRYLLAVDAGTGSGRAVLFDEKGKQIAVSQAEWTHASDPRFPGSMNFDVDQNWKLLARAIREVLTKSAITPSDVVGISATSMREGIVLYDNHGQELWACANVDARAARQVRALQTSHPDIEKRFYHESGQTFALGAIPRLLWVKEHLPAVYDNTHAVTMLSDWVIKRLSGEIASDPSNAGTTGIFSLKTRQWSPDMTRTLGLRDDFFPQVYESGHVIGQVTASAAKDTGLAPHTPVVMGGGDAQLGSVGLGVVKEGQAAILGGTFWQQEVNMATPKTDPEMNIRVNPHVVEGLSQAEAIVFFAGLTLRWFRDAFCQEEIKRAEAEGVDAYTILESMAREVPAGSRGIIPVFSDEMRYHQWYHAAPSLLNLTLDASRCGKAEIFRALQENAAIVAAANLERIFSFTQVENEFLVFAGGASKGEVWCQILADVTEKPVRVPVVKEATALGTAIAAGKGVGIFENFQRAADELVSWEKEYTPDPANVELYRDVKNRWREAYKPQRELVDRGVTEALWKAPGL